MSNSRPFVLHVDRLIPDPTPEELSEIQEQASSLAASVRAELVKLEPLPFGPEFALAGVPLHYASDRPMAAARVVQYKHAHSEPDRHEAELVPPRRGY